MAKGCLLPASDDDEDGQWVLEYRLGGEGGQPFTGRLEGLRFLAPGASAASGVAVEGAPWLDGYTGFTASYTREL